MNLVLNDNAREGIRMLILVTNMSKSALKLRHLNGETVKLETNETMIVEGDSTVLEYYKPLETVGFQVRFRSMMVKTFLFAGRQDSVAETEKSEKLQVKVDVEESETEIQAEMIEKTENSVENFDEILKDETIKDEIIEDKTIEDKIIKDKAIQNETSKDKTTRVRIQKSKAQETKSTKAQIK